MAGAPISTGREARLSQAGDYHFFAGWRSDPFFFDTLGALNNMQFTGVGTPSPNATCAASCSKYPTGRQEARALGAHRGRRGREMGPGGPRRAAVAIGIPDGRPEGRLLRGGAGGRCPVRRGLRPLAGAHGGLRARRSHAGGRKLLLPDILLYDPSLPASYPNNGRGLSDDAMDVFISMFTNGKVTTDNVGPREDLLKDFRTSAQPHKERFSETVTAA